MNKVQKIRDDLSQMSPMEREKHKEALAKKLMNKDPSVYLVKPEKSSKSCAWGADCFSLIFNNNVKENYVYCQICNNLITYNSVHGTGSLLRHHCYKKVMNMQREETAIAKTLNFTVSPKILKNRPRPNENTSPLGDILLNSTDLKIQLKGRDNTKQKKEIEELIARGDPTIDMRAPENIKSEVWSNGNFKILFQNGKKLDFVMCLFCHSLITYKSKTGTASLLRHSCIKRLTETIKRERTPNQDDNIHEYVTIPISEEHADEVDATQTTSGADNLSFGNENDTDQDQEQEQYLSNDFPDELKEEAIKLFHYFSFKDMQPTNLAQRKGFLSFGQYLINVGAEYKRVHIAALLDGKHSTNATVAEKSANDLQNMLKPIFEEHKIALSCDYWHDPNRKMNFLTLYGHYISAIFEIKKVNLGTVSFVEEFSTIDYKQLIATMLENYFTNESDIEAFLSKTTTVVFDEMLDCFKSFSTINCSCLTLNRIVMQLMDECGLRETLPSDILITDNWCNVWEYLTMVDDNVDTIIIDEFKRMLDPFAKAVKSLSSDQKPTINEVYIFRKKIEDHFRNARFTNPKIRDVALNLIRENFPITNLHKIAVFLDPRFKSLKFMSHEDKANVLSMVSKMVSTDENDGNVIAFGEESNEKHTNQVSAANKSSGTTISDRGGSGSGSTSSSGGNGDITDSTKYLIEYMDIVEERDETHDEVEIYLNLKFNDIYSTNILEFWESRYDLPHLKQLAQEILCIPASSIITEKIFSDDANLLSKRRLNMEIENVKQMLYIHENSEMLMQHVI